jgi:hypothetical protein
MNATAGGVSARTKARMMPAAAIPPISGKREARMPRPTATAAARKATESPRYRAALAPDSWIDAAGQMLMHRLQSSQLAFHTGRPRRIEIEPEGQYFAQSPQPVQDGSAA